jgi:hypothetical protein
VLEGSEITKPVLEALSPVVKPLIGEIVEKYDIQLHKNGEYMTPEEKRRLTLQIKDDMKIKLNLSINLTKKKMDTWEIFPKSEKQQELNFEGEGEAQREQLKEGAFFEVEGLNQGEGEEVPGDPEGEGQVPEGQLLDTLLEESEEEEAVNSSVKYLADQEKQYQRRKAAFKKKEKEAAVPLN